MDRQDFHHQPMLKLPVEAALDTPQSYFDDVKTEYLQRRNLLISELRENRGDKSSQTTAEHFTVS